ncbi:deaminated glutathione amidase-like isoform X2 [Periplaneta americana]|uniref:deaminated glutathione amidase-like isoform X2 n=1 Tax=Periplaneta americana TaxID=6978 RepID=UPI0037E8EA35
MMHLSFKIIRRLYFVATQREFCSSKHSIFEQFSRKFRTMATSSHSKIIGVCQMTATNKKEDNIQVCSKLIKAAKDKNCEMVFLPEACDYIGESKEETLAMSESLDEYLLKTFCNLAKENEIWLSLGGIHVRVGGEKLQNTHIIIDATGNIVAKYEKSHLFDVNLPEQGIRLMESDYVLPGQTIVPPVETPVGKVGLSICYDMRFPELSLTLAGMGAEILTFPSAFTYVTGAAHWETILRTRAIESQSYVVAAAQTGSHNKKRISWGHAMIVDPWGTVIAHCSEDMNIATAEINLSYVQMLRESMPIWSNRRNDLYRMLLPKLHEEKEYKWGNTVINPESIVCKTSQCLAFVSRMSILPGHVVVIPLRNVKKLSELNTEEMCDMFSLIQRIQSAFEACYNISSNTVYFKDGCQFTGRPG